MRLWQSQLVATGITVPTLAKRYTGVAYGLRPARCGARTLPMIQLVAFRLDEQQYALALNAVERVVRAVEITPLPQAPEAVLGMINFQGEIMPVVNLRKRLRLPERGIELKDQFIVARTLRRRVALVADAVTGIVECSASGVTPASAMLPGLEYVTGIVKMENGLLLIHDLDQFLSLEEDRTLDEAVTRLAREDCSERV
jgi:purine-binding chemotaxis protein CheW